MRKILLILLLTLNPMARADELNVASQIIERISAALTGKQQTLIYANSDFEQQIVERSANLSLTSDCTEADLMLLQTRQNLPAECSDRLTFFTRYRPFKEHASGVGALFWQKGRVNILFLESRLQRFKVTLPTEWQPYIEESL